MRRRYAKPSTNSLSYKPVRTIERTADRKANQAHTTAQPQKQPTPNLTQFKEWLNQNYQKQFPEFELEKELERINILEIINNIPNTTATGPDKIPSVFYKSLKLEFAILFRDLTLQLSSEQLNPDSLKDFNSSVLLLFSKPNKPLSPLISAFQISSFAFFTVFVIYMCLFPPS